LTKGAPEELKGGQLAPGDFILIFADKCVAKVLVSSELAIATI